MNSCVRHGAGIVLRGTMSGAVGTAAMSAVILAGQVLGLFRTPPPEQITAAATAAAGEQPAPASPAFQAGWVTAHLLYGMACGAVYSILAQYGLRRVWPAAPRQPVGIGFGLLVWGASYLGFLPALRLYPRPDADTPGRIATMIGAHVVFGATLAEVDGRLAARD